MSRQLMLLYATYFLSTNVIAAQVTRFICLSSTQTQILQFVPDAYDKSPQSASYFDGAILWIGEKIERAGSVYSISMKQAGLQAGASELATLEFSLPLRRHEKYTSIQGPFSWPEIREAPFIFTLAFVGKSSDQTELFQKEMTCKGN